MIVSGKEQKALKTGKNGRIVLAYVLANTRLMSIKTKDFFDSLF